MRANPATLEIIGDGSATRDFIYIDDQVEGILRHLDYDGDLLNIGSGSSTTIRNVVDTLIRVMNYKGQVNYNAHNSSGVMKRRMLIERARAESGWPDNHEFVSLEEGLRRTVASLKEDLI
jgi:nucleoside-diphosphate-sugar epimerase